MDTPPKILVVDDDDDIRLLIAQLLRSQGYYVTEAASASEAETSVTENPPQLILMDISMPTLDGLGATRRIREDEELRDVPIIAVTAFGTEGFQRAAYDAGVSGYITKPIHLERMHQLIAQLLSPGGSGNLSGQL